jgi:anti-sigma B factor antagonist
LWMDASSGGAGLRTKIGPPDVWLTVELRGELDVATAPALMDEITSLIEPHHPPRVALELSGLDFCDSSGVNAFIRLWKRINAAGGQLALLRPRPRLAGVLRTTGVERYLFVGEALPEVPGTVR